MPPLFSFLLLLFLSSFFSKGPLLFFPIGSYSPLPIPSSNPTLLSLFIFYHYHIRFSSDSSLLLSAPLLNIVAQTRTYVYAYIRSKHDLSVRVRVVDSIHHPFLRICLINKYKYRTIDTNIYKIYGIGRNILQCRKEEIIEIRNSILIFKIARSMERRPRQIVTEAIMVGNKGNNNGPTRY